MELLQLNGIGLLDEVAIGEKICVIFLISWDVGCRYLRGGCVWVWDPREGTKQEC